MNDVPLDPEGRFFMTEVLPPFAVHNECNPPAIGERADANRPPAKFTLERWHDIAFQASEEWLIKRVLPRRGLAVIFGKPKSFKSFIAKHMALCVSIGREWAGRPVHKAPVVYVAAEGAAGLRKRKAGYVTAWRDLPADVDFALLSAAPNLGTDPGDLAALIQAIEAAGIKPGLIILDTIAKTIGGADENGAGMTTFISNAGALAQHFDCLVLAVHHVGLGDEAQKRLRGHSSLHGALDAQILTERREGENKATLTLQKLKDDADDVRFYAHLSSVVVALDKDGEEVSTLIVDDVTEAEAQTSRAKTKTVPSSQRLLRDILVAAIDEAGEMMRPFSADGPQVKAVFDETVRDRYYAAIAEKAGPQDDPDKLAERQRRAFNRAIESMLKAERLVAREVNGRRALWFP